MNRWEYFAKWALRAMGITAGFVSIHIGAYMDNDIGGWFAVGGAVLMIFSARAWTAEKLKW